MPMLSSIVTFPVKTHCFLLHAFSIRPGAAIPAGVQIGWQILEAVAVHWG